MSTKILIVDDEADVEDLLRQRFQRQVRDQVYQFHYASNGQVALSLMQAEPDFDVLLLDINMPEMDGLTLLGQLSQLLPHGQAVIVSAYGDIANIRLAMNRGAFDFLFKPINFSDLEKTIEKTAQHVRHLRESARVKEIADLKARFFDNITHEFRTPLTLITITLERLLREASSEGVFNRDLLTIDYNARHILRLINQLLELTKLETGHVQVDARPGDLGTFVAQFVDAFTPLAQQKGLQLVYQNDLTGHWLFDAQKIGQIVYNLLANALKFTLATQVGESADARPVRVRLSSGASVQLIVADQGIGIDSAQLPYIFDRFYQANPDAYQVMPGTGIGLSLVRELTELMGGKVFVESRTGDAASPSATTFTVELPLPSAPDEPLSPTELPPLQQWFPQAITPASPVLLPDLFAETSLILVVEDNDGLRTLLTDELSRHYRVLSAATGEEGWQLAQSELPEVVISDIMMPLINGYELTHLIKTTPATDHLAVILLTAKTAYDNLLTGLRQGADEYLTKPFHLEELSLRLHNLLTRQQRLRQVYGQQLTRTDLPQPLETIQDGWLRGVYTLLENHLDNPSLNVEWLADQLAMSRKTLLRKAQALTQLSPNELIRQYRLRKAADFLRAGHSVSETAYLTGFETPAYFGQCFKEQYQTTPSEFAHTAGREKMRQ